MLYELLGGIKTLSVIGMCKNAGKTTVLNSLISECENAGERLGLTSIGRDGERSDLVTNTKKPEIFIREGALVATAEQLLKEGDISMEILDSTGIPTPMGAIVVVRARSAGYVQLGGASITEHQKSVRDRLFAFSADRVLIDGAISRKSLGNPSLADGVILSSGASYDADIRKTADDTAYYARLLSLPAYEGEAPDLGRFTAITPKGAVGGESLSDIARDLKEGVQTLIIRGAFTDSTAKELTEYAKPLTGVTLAAQDASRLLLKRENYLKLCRFIGEMRLIKSTRLIAVTVNPFSAYGMHYDKNEFRERVEAKLRESGVSAPVTDVKDV